MDCFLICYWSNKLPLLVLACGPGFYGLKCSNSCSEHCINPSTCNHVTGSCNGECQDGWQDENCDKSNCKLQ